MARYPVGYFKNQVPLAANQVPDIHVYYINNAIFMPWACPRVVNPYQTGNYAVYNPYKKCGICQLSGKRCISATVGRLVPSAFSSIGCITAVLFSPLTSHAGQRLLILDGAEKYCFIWYSTSSVRIDSTAACYSGHIATSCCIIATKKQRLMPLL